MSINIMRPKLTRIANMCFRRLDLKDDGIIDDYNDQSFHEKSYTNTREDKTSVESKLKSIDVLEAMESDDELEDIDIKDISEDKGIKFRTELKVGKCFHKFLVGERGQTKNKIEFNTQTRITIPRQEDLTSAVIVTGNAKTDVKSAVKQIQDLVRKTRTKIDFNHFVSIPFNQNQICDRFMAFKTEILNDSEMSEQIDETLFQSCHKMHLTVVPLLLTDENETQIATKILEDFNQNYLKLLLNGQTVRVKLAGIDYMNDDPTDVNVLYAKVIDMSDNQCFQTIVDQLFVRFEESGLISGFNHFNAENRVKIHVTLLNSKFRPNDSPKGKFDRNRRRDRHPFDASNLIKRFGDYCFGETDVQTIDISIRGSNTGKDRYYSCLSRIQF